MKKSSWARLSVFDMAEPNGILHLCESSGCSEEAKMKCPTCIKLGIDGSWFCSQVRCYFMLIHDVIESTHSDSTNVQFNWPKLF